MADLSGTSGAKDASSQELLIGRRLHAARQAQLMSLDKVAATCGITKGYLSKLERGHSKASVATLIRICEALQIPVGSLFDNAAVGEVVRADAKSRIEFGGQQMAEYLLTPQIERRIQVIFSEIECGGGSGGEAYSLPADACFVYVIDGILDIEFAPQDDQEGRSFSLSAGDSLTFDPSDRHQFSSGEKSGARVLWAMTPALPEGTAVEFLRAQGNE